MLGKKLFILGAALASLSRDGLWLRRRHQRQNGVGLCQKRPHLSPGRALSTTSRRFLATDASQKSLAGWDLKKAGARRKLQL